MGPPYGRPTGRPKHGLTTNPDHNRTRLSATITGSHDGICLGRRPFPTEPGVPYNRVIPARSECLLVANLRPGGAGPSRAQLCFGMSTYL
jgi:hypothetical protein